jgi:hypothetical protein
MTVSFSRITMLHAVSIHAEEIFYQKSLSCLFVHPSERNALSSSRLACFRSSYTFQEYHNNNTKRSCYSFQINSPKRTDEKVKGYVSLLKPLLFTFAYTISIQLVTCICNNPTKVTLSTEEGFSISKEPKIMPKFSW